MDITMFAQAYHKSIDKIITNSGHIGSTFPHVAIEADGSYNREPPFFWTGGFWGGLLWLAYRETKQKSLYELACQIEEKQDEPLNEFLQLHHDVGFMWLPTAVTHYRQDGNADSRLRAVKAASLLAGRFNPAGNFLRAWNNDVEDNCQGIAIIDCLMNLPLLYWAWKEFSDPRFKHIAMAHADRVLTSFVRQDNTVPHMVRFNPETGEKIEELGGQGKASDSAWSRGQAWAIYGFALSYRETGEKRYLEQAMKCAQWFMSHLPQDFIPLWDFSSEEKDWHVKDTSAACCAASGILEISELVENLQEKRQFRNMAEKLLESLILNCACFDNTTEGIIRYGTVSYPVNRHVNVPIIYGDFFFVEALTKVLGKKGIF